MTLVIDIGLSALARIHKRLLIDESWTVRGDRGFAWTAYRLAQKLDASAIVQSRDLPVSVITLRTTVVQNVGNLPDLCRAFSAGLSRRSPWAASQAPSALG